MLISILGGLLRIKQVARIGSETETE